MGQEELDRDFEIDRLATDFEKSLRSGNRKSIEDILASAPQHLVADPAAHGTLFRELLRVDIEHRRGIESPAWYSSPSGTARAVRFFISGREHCGTGGLAPFR